MEWENLKCCNKLCYKNTEEFIDTNKQLKNRKELTMISFNVMSLSTKVPAKEIPNVIKENRNNTNVKECDKENEGLSMGTVPSHLS